jgi:glycerol-3-phosphate dehydrogenase (NAD(P)+)
VASARLARPVAPVTGGVAVVGAGAWGTALAAHMAARATAPPASVTLCFRDRDAAEVARRDRENTRYLPGVMLPSALAIGDDLAPTAQAALIVIATPVGALAPVLDALAAAGAHAPLLLVCKGFCDSPGAPGGSDVAHCVAAARWPAPVAVASGPSFAEEVARGLPTALAVAATAPELARSVAGLLRSDTLRAYETDDVVGIEVGGAVKNVLAIAAGASDGLGFGHNARAALVTRGLAEIARLAVVMGGRRETLMGLAGLGDAVLTCTGDLSRNRRVGLALARGQRLDQVLAALGHVAEGVGAARAAHRLARHHAIDMPVTDAVHAVLERGVDVRDAVIALMGREPRREDAW